MAQKTIVFRGSYRDSGPVREAKKLMEPISRHQPRRVETGWEVAALVVESTSSSESSWVAEATDTYLPPRWTHGHRLMPVRVSIRVSGFRTEFRERVGEVRPIVGGAFRELRIE